MLIPYHDDNKLHRFPVVTVALIALNVVSFGGFWALEANNPHAGRVAAVTYGFVPRELSNLASGQPVVINLYPDAPQEVSLPSNVRFIEIKPTIGRVAMALVTCMFMHAGILHLASNMLFLWVFGNNIEDRLGRVTFILFYLLGGILATLCHWVMSSPPLDMQPMIGASGAIAVMLGAYAVTYPKARVHVLFLLFCIPLFFELPALLVLGAWILLELYHAWQAQQGLITDVALWAHIGGFFFGAITMPFLPTMHYPPSEGALDELVSEPGMSFIDAPPPPPPDSSGIRWEDDAH